MRSLRQETCFWQTKAGPGQEVLSIFLCGSHWGGGPAPNILQVGNFAQLLPDRSKATSAKFLHLLGVGEP